MKLKLLTFLAMLILVVGGFSLWSQTNDKRNEPTITEVSGNVKSVATSAETLTITTTESTDLTLSLAPTSKLYDEAGEPVELRDVKTGMSVRATGTSTPTSLIVARLSIVSRPPDDADIGAPCPGVLTEDNNSMSCRMPVSSRITISLPSANYSKSSLSIEPASAFGETFGASTGDDRWVRTFEAREPGKVTLTVPSKNKSVLAFKVTFDVYGDAPAEMNAGGRSDDELPENF